MSAHRWTILANGTNVVDPQGWTIAKFYGDDADEHARIAVASVNSHDRLLAAAIWAHTVAEQNGLTSRARWIAAAIAAAAELKQ